MESNSISNHARTFIVLLAVFQGAALYLAQKGLDQGWWPFSGLGGRVCWYTLVLTVPTMMMLSVRHLRDTRFWQHVVVVAVILAALAAWAAWSATGAPGLRSDSVLGPFGFTSAVALFVALPWLQCRLAHRRWRGPYVELFEHAWQNALTLALAGLFTGICWAVLHLWASLFTLINIDFFRELFRETAFVHLATGAMAGLGILIGRTQHRPVQMARQIVLAIFKGLLPLLAFIAVLFILALPLTGLQPLWDTRSAAGLLLFLVALMVVFVNAVYQDGRAGTPYPLWIRRIVEAGLLVMPLFALLAVYALWLRIDQYGWTADRFWMSLAAVFAVVYAFGYAWAVLRPHAGWLHPLQRANIVLSWAVMAVAMLANSPLLDPHRISVASQIGRFESGQVTAENLDLDYLRFDSGRRGHAAVEALRDRPGFADDKIQAARLAETLQRTSRWGHGTRAEQARRRITDIDQAREHITLARGIAPPGEDWWQKLLAEDEPANRCLLPEVECILITADVDANGTDEHLLCRPTDRYRAWCHLYVFEDGQWGQAGSYHFYSSGAAPDVVRRALREGNVRFHDQRWPDLSLGDGDPVRLR